MIQVNHRIACKFIMSGIKPSCTLARFSVNENRRVKKIFFGSASQSNLHNRPKNSNLRASISDRIGKVSNKVSQICPILSLLEDSGRFYRRSVEKHSDVASLSMKYYSIIRIRIIQMKAQLFYKGGKLLVDLSIAILCPQEQSTSSSPYDMQPQSCL